MRPSPRCSGTVCPSESNLACLRSQPSPSMMFQQPRLPPPRGPEQEPAWGLWWPLNYSEKRTKCSSEERGTGRPDGLSEVSEPTNERQGHDMHVVLLIRVVGPLSSLARWTLRQESSSQHGAAEKLLSAHTAVLQSQHCSHQPQDRLRKLK